ncbi:hypothetical protein cypCar_00014424 [Cyprinus carpio]|nr:hypothetical protein cypCar_00014424 [Cyprinus carpio]
MWSGTCRAPPCFRSVFHRSTMWKILEHIAVKVMDGSPVWNEDEFDSLSPVFRDYPHLHEEVKAWVKDQKVQEIFMQGPYSLNGYRVRVYRQDSATQWFTGIITHHDLFSRTMVVMNDQVLEPQNVDPSMIQMTFLDDVVHSLLKGENIGITSRRRSRSSQNSNTAHGHYTRAQANSPRPVMNSSCSTPKQASQGQQQQQSQHAQQQVSQQHQLQQSSPGQQRSSRSSRRKGSDSSIPDDEKIKDEKSDSGGRDLSKNKSKQTNKRRKADEEDKKGSLKRLKTETSDLSESSDSENSNKRSIDSSSEHCSENELKCKSTSKVSEEEKKSQGSKPVDELSVINRLSPWDEMQDKSGKPMAMDVAQLAESERSGERRSPLPPPASCTQNQASGQTEVQSCIVEMKSTVKTLSKDHNGTGTPWTHTPKCVIDITEDANTQFSSRENSEAVSALLASQKCDAYVPESRHLVLNASHAECRRPDGEQQQNAHNIGEFTHSEVIRPVTSSNSSPDILNPKCNPSPDIIKSKTHSIHEYSKPKPNTSPEVSKHKPRHPENPPTTGRLALKHEPDIPRSSFKPVPARGALSESTKSLLVVDKNEHFMVYRDPALQQQFLQQQPPPQLLAQTHGGASYNQLGLYPIIWQYPNGTHSYPPGYKWVHPENAVNSDSNLRRNTSSPWLHHSTPVTSADSMGILSHVPGRPASAEPHRPIKISSHSSSPLSKTPGELHKEDQEKNVFVDPIRSVANAHLKQEPDRSRTPINKELHRLYKDSPHSKQQLPSCMPQEGPDHTSKYKEENRRILLESIEMAPFTAKIRAGETERESYSRISSHPKSHEKEAEHSVADLYKYKHSVSQSLPLTNYFTTLSNSVVNEPPRLFQSKDLNPYFDKAPTASSPLSFGSYNSSHTKSLSKPPPLIKHQPEGEGLVGKITEQLSQQAPIHSLSTSVVTVSERCSPAISPSCQPKGMPSLRRAPVFHPPTQQALDRKEGAYGRLSPPTLTPIQPVNSAGKVSEQQKPPTLLPELRDEKSGAELGSAESCRPGGEAKSHEKVAWHSDNSQGKPQAAMASVIVRPSTCINSVAVVTNSVCSTRTNEAIAAASGTFSTQSHNGEGGSRTNSPSALPQAGSTGPTQAYSRNFVHLKKAKAALAAAQSPQDNSAPSNPASKASLVPNGQPAQVCQSNYHKLKKAWLTRHSEEDKNTNKSEKGQEDKLSQEDRKTRRTPKRPYESGSESGDDSDSSESKLEQRTKRQPKPTYKKKQNDMQKRKGDSEKEEDEVKPNGIFRSAKEKTKLKLASTNGIPRSVLKDWRKVKKLKQTGESFLQDDSCSEIGPNLQKCRECRSVRTKKGEESAHSPVFCRFYHFRRLSYSKNGVIRIDGFSSPDQYDEEALSLWAPEGYEENSLDLETSKYILSYIGDKFCQLVMTENTATTWIKKDAKIAWKRAVSGVRESCDACEATLFNIHWVCQKCGFVVCLDCYKAKERKSSKDKELYAWLKCVKGQPHDHKHLMPTQIIPGTVLTDLVNTMHMLREKYSIKSHCSCAWKQNTLYNKLPSTNGVSQVLQNVLNHSNKISLCKPEGGQQNSSLKVEANGGSSPASDTSTESKFTPPESQSPLHFLADLAEQKSREEKKENKESVVGKIKEEKDQSDALDCKTSSLEQGSTLRDLLTTTAGKLRLGSTDAGIAFAPVYSTASQIVKSGRSMPNILDDIIASVVENKIPAGRGTKLNLKHEPLEESKAERKKAVEEPPKLYADIPHCWLYERRLLWLKDHRNSNNWKLFRECWRQGQPVLVSGVHKKLNASLWKAESFNQEFADHQGDLLNCKDGVMSNSGVKEFWDGFEDLTKRPKSKDGETVVYRLKDWPSGEEFMALMPSRYDDLMKNLPMPEYSDPEGNLNLASHLPSFFVRPDLGPRLCCAYGVAASQEQDFGTANLHMEVSDIISVLVYVGVAKGNGVLSKTGVLKRLEEEDLDDNVKKRLKDSSETPGALWHIYTSKDGEKIKEFLHKLAKEQGVEIPVDHDPIREPSWYLSRKLRQRLLEEYAIQGWTVVQFLGDSVLIPAGALHQVQNLHSCVQVINDFVSPEHVVHSFHLTQELRSSKEEINYEDKLQVKNIFYHCVKDAVGTLKRCCAEEEEETNS